MARTYASLATATLVDPEWLDLTPGAQWLFVTLLRQPKLSMWGTGDMLPRRWCTAAGVTVDHIDAWLNELELARYVHVDRGTDEFVIRTFTRHDLRVAALSGPVVKGMWSAWAAIASTRIRSFVVTAVPDPTWAKLAKQAPPEAAHIRRSAPFEWEPPSPFESQVPSPFETPTSFHLPPAVPGIINPETHAVGEIETETAQPEQTAAGVDADLDPVDVEQEARRALRIYGDLRTAAAPGVTDPGAYAASVRKGAMEDGTADRLRDLVRSGMTADEAAATVDAVEARVDHLLGSGDRRVPVPTADEVSAARERAAERERATQATIAASQADQPVVRRPGAAADARAALRGGVA